MRVPEEQVSFISPVMDYGSAMGWRRQKTSIGVKIKRVDRGKTK
jgi:hypothetical protein